MQPYSFLLAIVAVTLSSPSAAQASFQLQGPGFPIVASEDADSVVLKIGPDYFLWESPNTVTPILDPAVMNPRVMGMSPDGATLVGTARHGPVQTRASRWTEQAGWESLGTTLMTSTGAVATVGGQALDASRHGDVIVGGTYVAGQLRPFAWTGATGMVELEGGQGSARAVSADGQTITGVTAGALTRWNAAGEIIERVVTPPGSFTDLAPAGFSDGGDYIVGRGPTVGGFVWNPMTGVVAASDFNACCPVTSPLGSVGLGLGGSWFDVSRSGAVAVGAWSWEPATFQSETFAILWTPGGDARRLDDELQLRGVDLGGAELLSALHLSADGRRVIGIFSDPASGSAGWFRADLGMEVGRTFCLGAFINSTGSTGKLTAQGSATLGEQNLTLEATSLPPNAFAMAISSMVIDLTIVGPGGVPKICLGGNIGRHVDVLRNSGPTGTLSVPINLMAMPQTTGPPMAAMVGQTWNFQVWHRDTDLSLPSNMTEGISVLLH